MQQSQKPATANSQQHALTSTPPDGTNIVTTSDAQDQPAASQKPKKLVQLASKDLTEPVARQPDSPQVHVQAADTTSPPARIQPAPDGMLMPTITDENSTVMSSSDGDGKPASLDGKSVASATTFALDEKESLRPDDSASVQAAAEDDEFPSGAGSGLPSSRLGSDDGVPAFIDQLHEIRSMGPRRPQTGSSTGPQGVLYIPPQGPGVGALPGTQIATGGPPGNAGSPPDQKLLEALENPRDRIWVLKLEQDVIDFVKDPKESSLNLPQCNSFYRMLAHKIADYYLLGHSVDDTSAAVKLHKTPYCRIPQPLTGVVTPSTAASTPPPSAGMQMKILRRGDPGLAIANGSSMPSMANSENGDSGEEDKKKPVTRSEREARYEAARLRIMGEARPSENAGAQEKKDDSRSSSAAGKKPKRKQRDNSDDGFEPRSAFFTPTSAGAYAGNPIAFQNVPNVPQSQMPMTAVGYDVSAYQQHPGPSSAAQWNASMYPSQDVSQPWYQGQSQGHDLSKQFNQAMSFRQPGMPEQVQQSQAGYGSNYYQQPYGVPASWQGQAYPGMNQATAAGYSAMQGYGDRSSAQYQHQQALQAYAFGQLPSQAMGRPPSALEHPLPGSYKSPHFNPQSQTFVPNHGSGPPYSPYAQQQRAPHNGTAAGQYGMPQPLERQMSSHSQASSFGSPQHGASMHANRGTPSQPAQPLTHPLPQPVFPYQPSPNNPLPPKPVSELPDPRDYPKPTQSMHYQSSPQTQSSSSIAKWGTPASLPAKPPPSNEPFDPVRFAQAQRTPNYNPSGGIQGYGPMGNPLMSGHASPAVRRS